MQRIAMLSIQDDRSPRGGYFGAVKDKNNTTAVVLFMPQGLQLITHTSKLIKGLRVFAA